MDFGKLFADRIIELCLERDISINKCANMSGLTQSTLQHIVEGRSNNPKFLTITRVCSGLGITLKEFFDDKRFENVDIEY